MSGALALPVFFLRTAARNLRRGGQRVLVALLCVAFGVMSLVAMTLLSESIRRMLIMDAPYLVGADISMDRLEEEVILPEHAAVLETLRQSGVIDRYTLLGYTSNLTFRLPGSGELHFPSAGLGINPDNYPLVGGLTIGEPGNTGQAALLQEIGDVLVTYDLALEYDLQVGDELVLADHSVGASIPGRVRGIIIDTPNHQGSKMYYNLATAEALAASPRYLNTALLTSTNSAAARGLLEENGWRVFLASELAWNDQNVHDTIQLMLKGAGILGLLVGGIGIANTMQVLLRRRRKEVAVWKTLGYREGQLQMLFALEAALLGTLGSLLGAGLGIIISYGLVDLFSRTSTLLIRWTFSLETVLSGLAVGIVTSVIFAMLAIISASRVSPLALLRSEPLKAGALPRLQSFGLALVFAVPFILVTSLVMESFWAGIGVLLAALAGLVGLGAVFSALLWLVTRLLPLQGMPLANMSRKNLRRRGTTLVFAMIALFVGVVSLAFGTVVTQNAQRAMEERAVVIEGDNITILAPAEQEAAIRQAVASQPAERVRFGTQTKVRGIRIPGMPDVLISPTVIGREEPGAYFITGAPFGSQPDGVYLFDMDEVEPGTEVEITLWDGTVRALPVVGSYQVDFSGLRPDLGVLMSDSLARQIISPETVQASVKVPPAQLQRISARLGETLPQAMVINLVAYAARFTQTYHNLFVFAVAMAGLALLAGVLLVANSVSLAMLDRRYEIGVLKAMGYSRAHVQFTLVVEYTLVGLLATAAGLGVVAIFLSFVALANPMAAAFLRMPPLSALGIGAAAVALTLVTVLLVTWIPTRVSPAVVLNDRE